MKKHTNYLAPSQKTYASPFLSLLVLVVFVLSTFLAASPGRASPLNRPLTEPDWGLIWRDEFTGAGGVDISKWLYATGTGYPGGPPNWNTGEIEVMTDSMENVFQSNGVLFIRVLHSGSDPLTGWTSGRIETIRTNFEPPEGGILAIEARLQLPELTGAAAKGYWPAFWVPGEGFRTDYWAMPRVGEIDIMENVDGENRWWGSFHCGPSKEGGPCDEPHGFGTNTGGFSPSLLSAFHTYRVELDRSVSPQQLRWYVDGILRYTLFSTAVDAQTWDEATNHGFFIILDVAMGGVWRGYPISATASGGTMKVDYVRVYAWPVERFYLPITVTQ